MPKMPDPGEHHRHAVFVRGSDHLFVAHRAARLDNGGDAGAGRSVDAIPEREERIRGHHGAGQWQAGVSYNFV